MPWRDQVGDRFAMPLMQSATRTARQLGARARIDLPPMLSAAAIMTHLRCRDIDIGEIALRRIGSGSSAVLLLPHITPLTLLNRVVDTLAESTIANVAISTDVEVTPASSAPFALFNEMFSWPERLVVAQERLAYRYGKHYLVQQIDRAQIETREVNLSG